MYLLFAILGYVALAIVNILDKYLVSASKKTSLLVFVFYAGIFCLPLFLLVPWVGLPHSTTDLLLGSFSGFMFLAALLVMYFGFQKTEVSHSGPLVGVSTTLFVVLLSRLFLGEILTSLELIGIFIIVIGCVLFSFQKTKKMSGFSRALCWAILSGLLFACSHVSAKYMYIEYDFWTGTVWTKGIMGIFGVILLIVPSVRRELFKKQVKNSSFSRSTILPVLTNRIFSIVGTGLTQYAIALGSVSIVNALQGVQYAILIVLILFLTRYHPKVFKEFYTKSELILEVVAVIIVAGGLALLVVK